VLGWGGFLLRFSPGLADTSGSTDNIDITISWRVDKVRRLRAGNIQTKRLEKRSGTSRSRLKIQRFKDSKIQRFKDSKIQRFKDSKILLLKINFF
jgi:hypothetical protein